MSRQIKGIWQFIETVAEDIWAASADAYKEYVNFTSNGVNYIGFNLQHYTNSSGTRDNLQYLLTSTTADMTYVWQKPNNVSYDLGWRNEAYRTVDFGSNEQTVTDKFYIWFCKNAKYVGTETKPINGIWIFNEELSSAPFLAFSVFFTSNGNNFSGFSTSYLNSDYSLIGFRYYADTSIDAYLYDDFNNLTQGWQNEAYRTVDFGSAEQSISDKDYEWIEANAIKQSASIAVSFKHRYKNDTLIGTGTYKFLHYSIEKPIITPQLAAPTNVAITGSIISFDSVENATAYDILVNNASIGTYTP